VIPDAAAVGVEIERFNRACRPLGSE